MTTIKLSPSDLTFLWDECQRCFYLKVIHKFTRPAMPMPSIFTKIDGLMKNFFEGKATTELTPELPSGVIQYSGKTVSSQAIHLPGHDLECYITGRFDSVVKFDNGSYGVVDFKTSTPKPNHQAFYGRQLHAYMYALENPAAGKFSLSPISKLGLFIVEPNAMDRTEDHRLAYLGDVTYLDIPRDDAAFIAFLAKVMAVLGQPEPPPAAENCPWCQYRQAARQNLL